MFSSSFFFFFSLHPTHAYQKERRKGGESLSKATLFSPFINLSGNVVILSFCIKRDLFLYSNTPHSLIALLKKKKKAIEEKREIPTIYHLQRPMYIALKKQNNLRFHSSSGVLNLAYIYMQCMALIHMINSMRGIQANA